MSREATWSTSVMDMNAELPDLSMAPSSGLISRPRLAVQMSLSGLSSADGSERCRPR